MIEFLEIGSDKSVNIYSLEPVRSSDKVKVKDSRNRPGVAQRVPGGLGFHIS